MDLASMLYTALDKESLDRVGIELENIEPNTRKVLEENGVDVVGIVKEIQDKDGSEDW